VFEKKNNNNGLTKHDGWLGPPRKVVAMMRRRVLLKAVFVYLYTPTYQQ